MTTPPLLASGAAFLAGAAVLAGGRPPTLAVPLPPPAFAATVVSVGDGDTLRVADASGQRVTIRLACIDAPERRQAPHGAIAAAALRLLAPVGASVRVRPHTTDRYGRTVAEVFYQRRSTGLAMVATGQAFAYRKYLSGCSTSYLRAEGIAKRERLGVWVVPDGIARPWDWRAAQSR